MALAALILGEYELNGILPFIASPLFGIAMAEVVAAVAPEITPPLAVGTAALTAIGLAWAAWIQAGRLWHYVPTTTWLGVVVGVAVALLWLRSVGRRGPRSRTEPAPGVDE
ncbi:MAG: hypothetical protein QOG03_2420 [Actinomycetota bacterium]|nr:hypothetical protein [Actinomycetota bacterium]